MMICGFFCCCCCCVCVFICRRRIEILIPACHKRKMVENHTTVFFPPLNLLVCIPPQRQHWVIGWIKKGEMGCTDDGSDYIGTIYGWMDHRWMDCRMDGNTRVVWVEEWGWGEEVMVNWSLVNICTYPFLFYLF